MRTRVRRWGNSLAICIPRALAEAAQLGPDAELELTAVPDGLNARRVEAEPTLDELVAQITPENRHDEVDWGPAKGSEVW